MSAEPAIDLDHPEFGPDLLSDPSFVPCRDESCTRPTLHAAHEVTMRARSSRKLDTCPDCQTPVVVTQTRRRSINKRKWRHVIEAHCPVCGWTFNNSIKKRTDEDHHAR